MDYKEVLREYSKKNGIGLSDKAIDSKAINCMIAALSEAGMLNNSSGTSETTGIHDAVRSSASGVEDAPAPLLNDGMDGILQGSKKLMILMPCYRQMSPETLICLMMLKEKHGDKIGFIYDKQHTCIWHARDTLASRFMATDSEWALWIDDDMIVPFGNARMYNLYGAKIPDEYAGLDVVSRLLSARKTIVGALYFGRNRSGVSQFSEAFLDVGMDAYAHKAPKNEVRETKWVGGGCILVHRSVYDDILKKFPNLVSTNEKRPHRWYQPDGDSGEDVAFGIRANEAGHKSYVDLGCYCGHIGSYKYWGHNTFVDVKRNEKKK